MRPRIVRGSFCAPPVPKMVRECATLLTRKAMRVDMLPRISVLSTSALGFWVASTRIRPKAAPLLDRRIRFL